MFPVVCCGVAVVSFAWEDAPTRWSLGLSPNNSFRRLARALVGLWDLLSLHAASASESSWQERG